MPAITFDGATRIIDIGYEADPTVVTVADVYSRWKDWVVAGNAQFAPAFDASVGGNELGGGVSIDGYYFLRNDLGWRIRAADADHTLTIQGQLFGFDVSLDVYLPRPGRTIIYKELQSSRASVVDAAGGGLTAQQVRDALALSRTAAPQPGSVDDQLEKIKADTLLVPATL